MTMEKKILIAVPSMDSVPARFAHSLAMIRKVGQCAVTFEIGSLIYNARNNIAQRAVELEADFILWLDSDMIFAPDLLERLMEDIEKYDADMVSGLYFRRLPPYTPVLFDRLDIEGDLTYWTEFQNIPEDVFEIGGCGFGCVLMKADIIFDVQGKFNNCFSPIGNSGEDLSFCWRARQCGYKILCDPTIQCGHVGTIVITKDFWDSYRLSVSEEALENA